MVLPELFPYDRDGSAVPQRRMASWQKVGSWKYPLNGNPSLSLSGKKAKAHKEIQLQKHTKETKMMGRRFPNYIY